jgi:chromosome partitioning protein
MGKSTTAVSVAAGLVRAGARVLLIDTDTQGQVSGMLGLPPVVGLADLLAGEQRPEEAIIEAREQLWLLAGGRTLAGIKRLLDCKDFGSERTLSSSAKRGSCAASWGRRSFSRSPWRNSRLAG